MSTLPSQSAVLEPVDNTGFTIRPRFRPQLPDGQLATALSNYFFDNITGRSAQRIGAT